MKKEKLWILILSIVSLFFTSGLLAILVIYFGYRNRENINAKIGLIIGIITLIVVIFIATFLPIITGVSEPLVVFESCSMHHPEGGFEKILDNEIYSNNSISIEDADNWPFKNGINRGDILLITKANNLKIGDVIMFDGGYSHPILHRVIKVGEAYSTKGDNYKTNSRQLLSEKDISQDKIIGKVVFRIPFMGWQKLVFTAFRSPPSQRWFC